ncbi:MAG TPA: glycosyltransferase family 4 protein [Thermoanaerobaculia bacterium]|jgi:glycosyltransferase involved in cell wall biosynthesis
MRILHLGTDSFGGYGGIALYNRDLVTALTTLPDCEEVVVVPRVIPQRPHSLPPKVTFVDEAARGRIAFLRAVRRIRKGEFDLVVCAHVNLLPFARMAAVDPLLLVYGIDAWQPSKRESSNRLLHYSRAIISISDITRSRLLAWSHYAGPTYILPNAIHAEEYGVRPKPRQLVERWNLEGKRVLLTLGRVHSAERYKGFDEVLEVLPSLPLDVVYVIAGGGDDVPRLEQKAQRLGVKHRVVFTGQFPDSEKADLYSLADVYVMPSRGEGFGFVFLEAMAAGVPVIASKHDGGREAVRDGALGLLVDPASPAELRAAIVESLGKRERRVPEGLAYFRFANFESRVHEIVHHVRP